MGNRSSLIGIDEETLEEYVDLTYLSRSEIVYILKRFYSIDLHGEFTVDKRYQQADVVELFPALKYNPFRDRIFKVFSSKKDNHFSFEDMLDLCSVMSKNCPETVKATWGFKLFDLNDDNQINTDDIFDIIDRLTYSGSEINPILYEDKLKISKTILNEMDLQKNGSLGPAEFLQMVSKMPEFKNSLYFQL